jgi:hypothetical protein
MLGQPFFKSIESTVSVSSPGSSSDVSDADVVETVRVPQEKHHNNNKRCGEDAFAICVAAMK